MLLLVSRDSSIFSGEFEPAPRLLCAQGPLKEASKFASQISGAVNKKVMELDNDVDGGLQAWPGAEATVATGAGGVAAGWKPPTSIDEPGMSRELANDVPQELSSTLSIDEQVGLVFYLPQSPIRFLIPWNMPQVDEAVIGIPLSLMASYNRNPVRTVGYYRRPRRGACEHHAEIGSED